MGDDARLAAFWEVAKRRAKLANLPGYFGPSALESVPPPAWSFGADAEESEAVLAQLLADDRTTTEVAVADYEAAGEPLPEVGTLGIVLDGAGVPSALVVTTDVRVDDGVVHEEIKLLYRG